jgi:cation transport ATPase
MQAERAVTADSPELAQPDRARSQRARRSFWQVFGVPIVLGAVSIVGLIAALVGNGFYDAVSWITLSIPVIVIAKYLR